MTQQDRFDVAELEERYRIVAADWLATLGPQVDLELRFQALKREMRELVRLGMWSSGPADLLTLIGRHGDELLHSRLLAWLLDPAGRHGLGDAFLTRWLRAAWPDQEFTSLGLVTVDTEVTSAGTTPLGESLAARADLVIYGDGFIIVVENKVGAGEQPRQCERLYWSWAGTAPDVRWVFLTPTGASPLTAGSAEAFAACTPISYRQVREALAAALEATDGSTSLARASAQQYLATLDAHSTFTGRHS